MEFFSIICKETTNRIFLVLFVLDIFSFFQMLKVKEMMAAVYDDHVKSNGSIPENVFFMKQKISNACGTFALIHALANNKNKIDLGNDS